MRHRNFGKKLGRDIKERRSLFTSQARSMFTHGAIKTTDAKVKAIIPKIEKLSNMIVTKPELTAKRELFRVLQDQHWVNRVYSIFNSVFAGQTSNFTKTQKIKYRYGDDALIVQLSFVKEVSFKPEVKEEPKKEVKAKKVAKKEVKKEVKKEIKEKVKKEVKAKKETVKKVKAVKKEQK